MVSERSKLLAHVSSHKRQKLQLFLNLENIVTSESCTCPSIISSQLTGILTLFLQVWLAINVINGTENEIVEVTGISDSGKMKNKILTL